jgi:hypothetical protein
LFYMSKDGLSGEVGFYQQQQKYYRRWEWSLNFPSLSKVFLWKAAQMSLTLRFFVFLEIVNLIKVSRLYI